LAGMFDANLENPFVFDGPILLIDRKPYLKI
jgi:hypothetical protein